VTPFHLQRLDHVSLNVSDRARSIAWYRDVLGLPLTNEPRQDDWPAFMGERAQAQFDESGVTFQFEDHGNSDSVYLRDPDGHTIELTTYEL